MKTNLILMSIVFVLLLSSCALHPEVLRIQKEYKIEKVRNKLNVIKKDEKSFIVLNGTPSAAKTELWRNGKYYTDKYFEPNVMETVYLNDLFDDDWKIDSIIFHPYKKGEKYKGIGQIIEKEFTEWRVYISAID